MRVLIVAGVILAGLGGLLRRRREGQRGDVDAWRNDCSRGGGTEIDVTLQEFSVIPETDSAKPGEITFNVENVGPDDVHEFVIVKTELEPDALPTMPDGSMDETGEGVEVIDEIEDIPVGETQT